MLDFDTALDLMNKYGYTSISVHPFIYQNGDTIGICYTYNDEEYGLLERIAIFNSSAEFEQFLKEYNWVQTNGKLNHVRMILDNYESINPKVMFLRNEKIMVEGEMFDIEAYDAKENMRVNMDPASKVVYECGDLLLVYNEIKNRQLQYLKNLIALKNSLRKKYYDLQLEVDKYNKIKIDRELKLLPDYADCGIDETLEIALKDKYNIYVVNKPSYEEAIEFLKEIWDLCLNLELNTKYYEAQKVETDIRNEIKVVDQKLTLMRSYNDELKPLFGVDLIGKFRKINRDCNAVSSQISIEYINEQMANVNRKYSYFDKLDVLYTSDYLREAIQNSNYADLAIKYAKGASYEVVSKYRTPLNDVVVDLSIQYRDKLDISEQSILVLYNNLKYRLLCDAILNIAGFEDIPINKITKKLSSIKGFSKLKSECYDSVKRRIDDPVNQRIKSSLFSNFDFSSFETFISSLVELLKKLKNVNEKMTLNGDINMYVGVKKVEDLSKKLFLNITNDINSLIESAKKDNGMVGITLLKQGMPVLYSPYYFDLGEIYGKNISSEMFIKEMVNFDLLVDVSDIIINIDPNKVNVARYFTEPNIVENLSIVDDIKMSYKTTFCKYALTSNLSAVVTSNQSQVVSSNVSPVVSSPISSDIVSVPSVNILDKEGIKVEQSIKSDVVNNNVVPSTNNNVQQVVVKSENKENASISQQAVKNDDNLKVETVNKPVSVENKIVSTKNLSVANADIEKKDDDTKLKQNVKENVEVKPVQNIEDKNKIVNSNNSDSQTSVHKVDNTGDKALENTNTQVSKSEIEKIPSMEHDSKVLTSSSENINSGKLGNKVNINNEEKTNVTNKDDLTKEVDINKTVETKKELNDNNGGV